MNKKEWLALDQARITLGLEERASLGEIKSAYHRLSKKNHPDLHDDSREKTEAMSRITSAYELLRDHCTRYRIPLVPQEDANDPYDAEDWWMDRFGQDPLWGKG